MIVIDILVALVLFLIPMIIFVIKNKSGDKQTIMQKIMQNKRVSLMHALIGVFFAFTYFPLRYMHAPWKMFSFLHAYLLLFSFILPFALAYLVKGTNSAKMLAIVLSAILLLSPLTRPFILPKVRTMTSIASWDMAIPFNLCNISALIYLLAILINNQTMKNYMITLGLFGGVINNVQAHNTHAGTFWYYLTAESYFVHVLIIVIPVFMLLTNQIKPSYKHALYNAIWVFPFYFLAGFLINPAWKTNFHFTKPIAFTKGIIPTSSSPIMIFGEAVDPLYMTLMAVLVLVFGVLLFVLSNFLYKRVRPKFVDESVKEN